ncbi:MAG: aldolase [Rhizobacter sp.]|nr:aldolase [Rhizobacter sp.]
MKFLMITNDPDMARFATGRGVDRVFVDLELLGKVERQGHLSTVISRHCLEDVATVRPAVPPGGLLVRVNPLHESIEREIDAVIEAGADIIMLPMFRSPAEVARFSAAVGGRARTCLLVETAAAAENLRDCVRVPGIDEVHIGLNDLHLDLGLRFMFEPVANGLVDRLAAVLRDEGVPFGIGGLARVGEGLLPAELLLAEHARLGSTGAILSRTFHRQAKSVAEIEADMDFGAELAKLRAALKGHLLAPAALLDERHSEVQRRVAGIIAGMQARVFAGAPGV